MNHKERMLAVLYEKKLPDKLPHGDVTVDPLIAQVVIGNKIPEEHGNFLVYWITESFSDSFFERQRRLREFLGFDFAHVFTREPLTKIGETKEGYLLIGFTNYMFYVFDHQAELKLLMERLTDLQIRIAQEAVRRGADCIWLANDYAFNQGPFISPELLWELDFQYEKKIVDAVHKLGVPCVLHSCGRQTATIDMIVDMGVDALQPLAGNDIRDFKKRYGKKLSLIGQRRHQQTAALRHAVGGGPGGQGTDPGRGPGRRVCAYHPQRHHGGRARAERDRDALGLREVRPLPYRQVSHENHPHPDPVPGDRAEAKVLAAGSPLRTARPRPRAALHRGALLAAIDRLRREVPPVHR